MAGHRGLKAAVSILALASATAGCVSSEKAAQGSPSGWHARAPSHEQVMRRSRPSRRPAPATQSTTGVWFHEESSEAPKGKYSEARKREKGEGSLRAFWFPEQAGLLAEGELRVTSWPWRPTSAFIKLAGFRGEEVESFEYYDSEPVRGVLQGYYVRAGVQWAWTYGGLNIGYRYQRQDYDRGSADESYESEGSWVGGVEVGGFFRARLCKELLVLRGEMRLTTYLLAEESEGDTHEVQLVAELRPCPALTLIGGWRETRTYYHYYSDGTDVTFGGLTFGMVVDF